MHIRIYLNEFPIFYILIYQNKIQNNPNLIQSFISSRLARKTITNAVCDLKKIMFDQLYQCPVISFSFFSV